MTQKQQQINILQNIKSLIHHIDRKQPKMLENLKHYSQLYHEKESKLTIENQEIITNVIKIGMNYYMKIKQNERVANVILTMINQDCLTVENIEFILEVLYNNILIEYIFNDNKKMVMFISNVICQTINVKIHSKYIIENMKILVDLYTVTPSTDSLSRQLYKIKQDYITTLFTMYGLENNSIQSQSPNQMNQMNSNQSSLMIHSLNVSSSPNSMNVSLSTAAALQSSPVKSIPTTPSKLGKTSIDISSDNQQNVPINSSINVNTNTNSNNSKIPISVSTNTSNNIEINNTSNTSPNPSISPLFSVTPTLSSRKIIQKDQQLIEDDNNNLNQSIPKNTEMDIIAQEMGKEEVDEKQHEKRKTTALRLETYRQANNYAKGDDEDTMTEEEVASISDTETSKPDDLPSPIVSEELSEESLKSRYTLGLSNETIQQLLQHNVNKVLKGEIEEFNQKEIEQINQKEIEEITQKEIEEEIEKEVKKQMDEIDQLKELEKRKLEESTLLPHYLLLQIFTKISTEDHRKMFVISETLLRGNYRQMTGKRALTLKMERMVLNLVEFWLSRCPTSITPTVIEGWNIDMMKMICKNAFSNEKLTFTIALKIFVNILKRFRKSFKKEIGYLMKHVYLYYLRSPLPYINFKKDIIEEFHKLSTDSTLFIELFLNYDCEENGLNIFEDIVSLIEYILSPQFKTETIEEFVMKNLNDSRRLSYKILQGIVSAFIAQYQTIDKMKEIGMTDVIDGVPSAVSSNEAVELLNQRKQKMNIMKFKELFKKKPKDGIAFLIDNKLCENSIESIATYLYKTEGLDKTSLGKYLTTKNEFNEKIFDYFVQSIDFTGLSVDEGLRKMFSLFVMPGEGQVVDRVMELFGKYYAKCWSEKMKELGIDNNHIYFIATTIIFLSTETHNANVKQRTMDTYEKFKGMIEQFDFTLPDDYLYPIYERVTQNAFLIPKEENVEEMNLIEKQNLNIVKVNPLRREELLNQGCQIHKCIELVTSMKSFNSNDEMNQSNKKQNTEENISNNGENQINKNSSNTFVSIINEDILKAALECSVPLLLKSMRIAFEDYGTVDVAKFMKQLVLLCIDLKQEQLVAMIVEVMCQSCIYYTPTNKQKIHLEMTRIVIDLVVAMNHRIYRGWKYIFRLLSHLEVVGIFDDKQVAPLTTIPKNTRKLFFMDIEHKLYQPKPSQFPVVSQSGIQFARKELKEWLEKGRKLFDQLISTKEENYEIVIECLCEIALEELDTISPPLLLLSKLRDMTQQRKTVDQLPFTERTCKIMFDFLTQCSLHPHCDVAKIAINTLFICIDIGISNSPDVMKYPIIVMCDSPVKETRVNIIDTVKDSIQRNKEFTNKYWKELMLLLKIASFDEDISIIQDGYEIMKLINIKQIQYDKKYYQYYLSSCVSYLLNYDRADLHDLESISILMNSISQVLQLFNDETVEFTHTSPFNQVLMNVLEAYRQIITTNNLHIASMAFQSLNQIVDKYIDQFSYENLHVLTHDIYVKILENIGYYHKDNSTQIDESKNVEWLTSIILTNMLTLSQFISTYPTKLSFFLYDYVYIITTFIIKGGEFVSHIGILALKDVINYVMSTKELVNIFVLMNNDIMNYFFNAVLSFTLQQNSLINEIEKDKQNESKKEEEQYICSICQKHYHSFEELQCPLCHMKFCSVECQSKCENHSIISVPQEEPSEKDFIPHKFTLTRLDIPFITKQFIKYIDTFFDFTDVLVTISEEANENILNCLIFNVERFLNVVDQTKTGNTHLKYVKDLTNNVQKLLVHYVKRVFKLQPIVFIRAVHKLVLIQSNTIIHFTFDLLSEISDELLLEMAKLSMPSLYKLILHDDVDVRKSLFNLLMRIETLSHSQ